MTDKIASLKNKINNIPVPTDKLDDIILTTVHEHAPKRTHSLRKKLIYGASGGVAAIGLLLGSATVSPAMAGIVAKIPIVGSIFKESGDPGLSQMSNLGLTQVIGESKKIGDKTLTIDEVFYDGTRFTLSYSLESEKPMSEDYIDAMDFIIDGKQIAYGISNEITYSASTHHKGIAAIDTAKDLPETFSLNVMFIGKEGDKWEFSLPIHAQTNVKTIVTNYEQEAAGVWLSVTDIIHGPAGLKVNYKMEMKDGDLQKYMADLIGFRIEDDLGNELVLNTGSNYGFSEDGKINIEGNEMFNPISNNATKLTVTPYFNLPKERKISETNAEGEEIVFDLTQYKSGELEFDSFTVYLNEKYSDLVDH